jgi:hypothetical protein
MRAAGVARAGGGVALEPVPPPLKKTATGALAPVARLRGAGSVARLDLSPGHRLGRSSGLQKRVH